MKTVFENEITEDTKSQIEDMAKELTPQFFTVGFAENMRIDMGFQRAVYIKEGARILSCIVYTCLDGSLHITMMATRRELQGKGYGKKLIQKFFEYALSVGLNGIELLTFSPESKPAYTATVGFYKSVGFEIEREHRDLWEKGTTTLKMRKEL